MIDPPAIDRAVARAVGRRGATGAVLRVEDLGDGAVHTAAAGNVAPETPFFVASTTKLYTLVVVARLADRGLLSLGDRLVEHADPALVDGLHVLDLVDHTAELTLRHLLSQTSGLADYFDGRSRGKRSLYRRLRTRGDRAWSVAEAVAIARDLGPHFAPGTPGRAHYSDTNYQLLGHVVERVTGDTYASAVRREVVDELGLRQTWVFDDPSDERVLPLRYRGRPLHIPLAMASTRGDGAVVSTAGELATFLRALVERRLTPRDLLDPDQSFEPIFRPFDYGLGVQRFALPRWMSLGRATPTLIGHSGLSGAFAFHVPDRDLLVTGTVNDLATPSRSFRMVIDALA